MKNIRPLRDLLLCKKTTPPEERDLIVDPVRLSYLNKPGLFWAEVISVGPEVQFVKDGDSVLLPTTMEPVRANHVLVRESDIIGVATNDDT